MSRDTRTGTAFLFRMRQLQCIKDSINKFPKNKDKFLDELLNLCRLDVDTDEIDFIDAENFKENPDYNDDCFYIGRFYCVNIMTGEGDSQFQPFYIENRNIYSYNFFTKKWEYSPECDLLSVVCIDIESEDQSDSDSEDQSSQDQQQQQFKITPPPKSKEPPYDSSEYRKMIEYYREQCGNKSFDILQAIVEDETGISLGLLVQHQIYYLQVIYEIKLQKYAKYKENSLPQITGEVGSGSSSESGSVVTRKAYRKTFDQVKKWRDELYKPETKKKMVDNIIAVVKLFQELSLSVKHKNILIDRYLLNLSEEFLETPTTFELSAESGTGKTYLAQFGLAKFFDLLWIFKGKFVNKPLTEVLSAYVGESATNMLKLIVENNYLFNSTTMQLLHDQISNTIRPPNLLAGGLDKEIDEYNIKSNKLDEWHS
jgi:hypothetical protein